MPQHAERDMYHSICAYLMSSTIDVTVAFVVHAKTLQTYSLAWRVQVACQMRVKQGTVKYEEEKVVKEDCSETPQHQTVSVSDCFQRTA